MREPVLGETVTVTVDRPLGSRHPAHPNIVYPVNYGYVNGVTGGDGEAQDAYILGIDRPVARFTGQVIGVIHRRSDRENKWVVVPAGLRLHQAQIMEQVHFQEQYFHSYINAQYERSCGVIPFRRTDKGPEYLLVFQRGSRTWSFPKGHMEAFESEWDTACRELWEETHLTCRPLSDFRETLHYSLGHRRAKTVVLFLGEVRSRVLVQRSEILEARFLPPAEALQLLQPRSTRRLPYRKILERAGQIIARQPVSPGVAINGGDF